MKYFVTVLMLLLAATANAAEGALLQPIDKLSGSDFFPDVIGVKEHFAFGQCRPRSRTLSTPALEGGYRGGTKDAAATEIAAATAPGLDWSAQRIRS
jgi:hypothetical protein